MLKIYRHDGAQLDEVSGFEPNSWIRLVDPTDVELDDVARECAVSKSYLEAALDVDEISRVEGEEDCFCVVANVPFESASSTNRLFETMPISIVVVDGYVITVCLSRVSPLDAIIDEDRAQLDPHDRIAFVCRILLLSSELYQRYLRTIDEERQKMIDSLGHTTSNTDLVKLHKLESALVYFETGLRGNQTAFELISEHSHFTKGSKDTSLIHEVMLENNQAIQMTSIYRELVRSTRELFSSAVDNTLNSVMKILTSLTIILAVPTIISGFYGMNVTSSSMPFASATQAFGVIFIITVIICIIVALWLHKKDLL